MSIFSKLRGAKKDAVVHKKADTAATSGDQAVQKPAKYRHIPTHAAIDALSGAPSSWKAEDRSKIQAQNKRRSAMVTRNNSGYSTPTLARNSSYNGSSWGNEGRPTPHNGTMFRQYDAGVGRSSPLASHDISPIASCSNSTNSNSSSQILEIRQGHRPNNHINNHISNHPSNHINNHPSNNPNNNRPQQGEASIFDSLHKSTTRKVGEAPVSDSSQPQPQAAAVAPIKTQTATPKRRFGFGKKSTAIAV